MPFITTASSPAVPSFKVIIVGDSGVGKTQLVARLMGRCFSVTHAPTIGVELANHSQADGGKLQLWDMGGQASFAAITEPQYRGALVAVIVFDVTSRASFDRVRNYWLARVAKLCGSSGVANDPRVVLLGNKCDLRDARVVETREAEALAAQMGSDAAPMLYFECSAKVSEKEEGEPPVRDHRLEHIFNAVYEVAKACAQAKGCRPLRGSSPLSSSATTSPSSTPKAAGHPDVGPVMPAMPALKVCLVGSESSGKTTLHARFVRGADEALNDANGGTPPTSGVDFGCRVLPQLGHKLHVLDTAGSRLFRPVARSYVKSCAAVMVCFNARDRGSLEEAAAWLEEIGCGVGGDTSSEPAKKAVLVALQCDGATDHVRVVSPTEGIALAARYGVPYIETTASDGTNVDEAFLLTATTALLRRRTTPPTGSIDHVTSTTNTTEKRRYLSCLPLLPPPLQCSVQ